MSKMKSRQAVKKRFKITKNGKLMHSRAGKNHLLTGKSANRKKNLSGETEISKNDKKRIKQMLPGY